MRYTEHPAYIILENLVKSAGIKIEYVKDIPDYDYARSKDDIIQMPFTDDAFESVDHACMVLGHEVGHILSGLETEDALELKVHNEAVCDLIGVYLYRLAERMWEKKVAESFTGSKADGE